jgi:hypothetical protein
MKAQRDPIQQLDAHGVVFGLFAIVVICSVTWAVALHLVSGTEYFCFVSAKLA